MLKTCLIDGIDPISIKLQTLFNGLMTKTYDILELRKADFEIDYENFNKTLNDLELTLYNFMNTGLSKINATLPALKYVERLQKLNIPKLDCSSKFEVLFKQYGKELEDIKDVYLSNYLDPPIPNDASPVIGKICWARVLSKKIENPIHYFTSNMSLMNDKTTKKIVYNYNVIQQVLVEFEMVYHQAWFKSVESLKDLLQVPPLAKNEETVDPFINLDSVVLQVFEEANSMIKLNLPVPHKAKVLLFSEHDVKHNKYLLQVCSFVWLYSCSFVLLFVCLLICLLVCLFLCLFGFLFVCFFCCLFVLLFVCSVVCLFCYLIVLLFVCLFCCLFVC